MKKHSYYQVANDIEHYAGVVSNCFLTNASTVDWAHLGDVVRRLNDGAADLPKPCGFVEELYAPRDEFAITSEDRAFYTKRNARRLDYYAQNISELPLEIRNLILAPLLAAASVHANTSGVFKGFYKDANGVGKFGGEGANATDRILGEIRLSTPVLSTFESEQRVFQEDVEHLPDLVDAVDLAYLDPPYNQHPYGSNYFMLNLLASYKEPSEISTVSGIPPDWQRSSFNKRRQAFEAFQSFASRIHAKYLLVSYNDEGFISPKDMETYLSSLGNLEVIKIPYNTFRGSRNLRNRNLKVTEHLYLVDR